MQRSTVDSNVWRAARRFGLVFTSILASCASSQEGFSDFGQFCTPCAEEEDERPSIFEEEPYECESPPPCREGLLCAEVCMPFQGPAPGAVQEVDGEVIPPGHPLTLANSISNVLFVEDRVYLVGQNGVRAFDRSRRPVAVYEPSFLNGVDDVQASIMDGDVVVLALGGLTGPAISRLTRDLQPVRQFTDADVSALARLPSGSVLAVVHQENGGREAFICEFDLATGNCVSEGLVVDDPSRENTLRPFVASDRALYYHGAGSERRPLLLELAPDGTLEAAGDVPEGTLRPFGVRGDEHVLGVYGQRWQVQLPGCRGESCFTPLAPIYDGTLVYVS
ncbi:MAG: hypothetical protein AAF645_24590, partial [Myxococcota bacterium]